MSVEPGQVLFCGYLPIYMECGNSGNSSHLIQNIRLESCNILEYTAAGNQSEYKTALLVFRIIGKSSRRVLLRSPRQLGFWAGGRVTGISGGANKTAVSVTGKYVYFKIVPRSVDLHVPTKFSTKFSTFRCSGFSYKKIKKMVDVR